MMKSPLNDFNLLVAAMKKWSDPDGPYQKKILADLSIDPVALKITYTEPAPDGDFEILFIKSSEVESKQKGLSSFGPSQVISFSEGMRLAQKKNCCGGQYMFNQGRKLISLNPSLQDEGGTHHFVM